MDGCLFLLIGLGVGVTDTPDEIKVWDCGSEYRYTVENREVYVYDTIETDEEELFIYGEMK